MSNIASVSDLLARIEALELANHKKDDKLAFLEAKIEKLEATISLKANTIDLLQQNVGLLQNKTNHTEQYTMRPQLRIHGIPAPKGNESNADVLNIVREVSEDLGVEVTESDIFRAHRVGKVYPEKKKDGTTTGRKLQSVIVRFRSWEKRCELYRARPRKGSPKVNQGKRSGKNKKEKSMYTSISLDLSKATRDLLDIANSKIQVQFSDRSDCYAFADINCNLCMTLPSLFILPMSLDKIFSNL